MKYNGKTCNGLGEFIAEKKKDWMADKSRSMEDNVKYWEDEGIVWAVQEYYGSMGEFTDADIEVIEHCFGQYASDIIDICEGD
jgi:hypothetical protein